MGSIDNSIKFSRVSAITQFNAKAAAFETNLQNNLETFKELILDVEQIKHELETCETELLTQKQKCERKMCCSSEIYEKMIESKNNIIQLAVTTAIRIDETKNLSMVSELLKILCGDIEMLTPPTEIQDNKENTSKHTPRKKEETSKHILITPKKKLLTKSNSPAKKKKSNTPKKEPNTYPFKKKKHSPKREMNSSLEDVSFREDSVSEIDATPGRTSPIIPSKKLRSSSSVNLSGSSTDSRDKKKCPDDWNTPEAKQLKLYYSSPKRVGKGKLFRQSRLSVVYSKPSNIVDLTCSPELSGGSGDSGSQNPQIQLLIKKEPSENDDTILPSPTSGPPDIALSRTASKDTKNFKKPLSLLRMKTEQESENNSPIIQFVEKKCKNTTKENEEVKLEESINILKPNRFAKSPLKQIKQEKSPAKINPSPVKTLSTLKSPAKPDPLVNGHQVPMDEDITHCEESSMSILQHVNKLEQAQNSPSKRPLGENQNIVNVPADTAASSPTRNTGTTAQNNHKRKILEKVEPVYKEPTVRKKAEKLALPGWCCDECKNFFGNLYGDDADKIKAVIDRCSKHRGRNNPVRAKTPPGFWNPRWTVPENTEEFNKRNNAD